MDKWVELWASILAVLLVALLIPGLVILMLKAFTALDCYVKKDPVNFSCYYAKGFNHRLKLEDLP